MFPLRDENPTELTPVVTIAIIAANVLVWLLLQGAGMGRPFLASLCDFGAIPGAITGAVPIGSPIALGERVTCEVGGLGIWTVLTSMFLHGSWMHLIGNMWFLWVFGNNIEDSMGHLRFALFYLLTGIIASVAHIATAHESLVPTVGASGAISGIMGAYIVLYPHVRVHTAIFFVYIARVVALPALAVLGLWFALQLLQGSLSLGGPTGGTGGVAFWAHIGGFASGAALIMLFRKRSLVEAKRLGRGAGY
jgi:membrane associated rhomboid family serine protease